jgi:hypothetical protein
MQFGARDASVTAYNTTMQNILNSHCLTQSPPTRTRAPAAVMLHTSNLPYSHTSKLQRLLTYFQHQNTLCCCRCCCCCCRRVSEPGHFLHICAPEHTSGLLLAGHSGGGSDGAVRTHVLPHVVRKREASSRVNPRICPTLWFQWFQ